ncbi:MAG TPA: efflux transporter outer membrane subunit [Vicinamibacterales bacterium]|nr:efflux transporter outer membrane subunit [Vicinamibacterales bacterium]
MTRASRNATPRAALRSALILVLLASAACAPKMKYVTPAAEVAPAFKENVNWKAPQPSDTELRGNWWELFKDSDLNALEERIDVSNQNLKAAESQFVQARALVRATRSNLFPTVTADPSIVRARQSTNRATGSVKGSYADFLLPADVSYEADVWGRIRNAVEASRFDAQASAADLETARLSVHAELAVDYFSLRGIDREKELLDSAVAAFEKALDLTQNRFRGGIVSEADVALAETQLETTRAQAVDVEVERAALEHAIAVLVGQPASTFSVGSGSLRDEPPGVPAGVPSALLERRPDIAAAERRVAAANAQVGVATAAFYPILTLSGSGGFESSSIGNWLASASNFWTIGPAALVTVFDAGRRHAVADQARAAYAEAAAEYRQSILSAFGEVEDQLAALRVLDNEATIQNRAVDAAERSLEQATNRYRGGLATYLEVTSAQNVALTNERVAVEVLTRRMTASVLLMKGLGGGWQASTLPQVP